MEEQNNDFKKFDKVLVEAQILDIDESNRYKYKVSINDAYIAWTSKVHPITDDIEEIRIGDIVRLLIDSFICNKNDLWIVTNDNYFGDDDMCQVMNKKGYTTGVAKQNVSKTGQFFDVSKLLGEYNNIVKELTRDG